MALSPFVFVAVVVFVYSFVTVGAVVVAVVVACDIQDVGSLTLADYQTHLSASLFWWYSHTADQNHHLEQMVNDLM